ncbi:MAG: AraC family transcriptional regulator [Tunicatimonas sp.]
MKLLAEKFANLPDTSFSVEVQYLPYRDPFLHFHDDYELVTIMNARGTRFIGDHVSEFYGTEVVLVAPALPHCWHIVDTTDGKKPEALVIHFSRKFMGEDFFKTPELASFYSVLKQATRGVLICDESVNWIAGKMDSLLAAKGIKRLLMLLEIFESISTNQSRKLLASMGYTAQTTGNDYRRINIIYEFVNQNFAKVVDLKEVADLVHLSPASFCRFFKKTTKRTFFDYLKEIKVGHASKLLRESNLSIAEICYASGYNNVANFNRQFKQVKALNPSNYRKAYHKGEVFSITKSNRGRATQLGH